MSTTPAGRPARRRAGRTVAGALAALAALAAAAGCGLVGNPTADPAPSRTASTGPTAAASAGSAASGTAASGTAAPGTAAPGTAASGPAGGWDGVLAEARGQTVHWYMYGGDDTLNGFVTGYVADRMRALGVTLDQVRVTDTGDAVDKVLGEKQAGRTTGGSVDAVWVNGENFATGRQAGLWECGWAGSLPNARHLDSSDPAVATDFGVPVDGCEAAWQQADSALVYDSDALGDADVASVSSLFTWARAHPGRFTYPAPPDFTGSMAVRTVLYDTIGGPSALPRAYDADALAAVAPRLWQRLQGIEPALWRGGSTYPQSQTEVEKLYADGVIDAYFTYGPGAVADQVAKGTFPASTREAVLSVGNIANTSFVAIPADAADAAGAKVLANVLQDPATQLALYRAEGIYPAIDLARTDAATRAAFAAVPVSPSVLPLAALTANARPELASGYIDAVEDGWRTHVLQQ